MKKLKKPSTRMGARCCQDEGLYCHPAGTSGPGIGISMGTMKANTIINAPTNVSFAYTAASDAQKASGAKAIHKPTSIFATAAQIRPV